MEKFDVIDNTRLNASYRFNIYKTVTARDGKEVEILERTEEVTLEQLQRNRETLLVRIREIEKKIAAILRIKVKKEGKPDGNR